MGQLDVFEMAQEMVSDIDDASARADQLNRILHSAHTPGDWSGRIIPEPWED